MGAPVVRDPAGRVVTTLRLSVTDRCDLRCSYCMPRCGVTLGRREDVLTIEEMHRAASILVERFGLGAVRLTGGEPLVRAGLDRLVEMIASLPIDDLALTTNGQGLGRRAAELRARGLMRVNVSLDTLDESRYRSLTGGGDLARTVEGIEAAIAADLAPVKINMVVLRGVNDDEVVRVARFGLDRGAQVRFLELMPIGEARQGYADLFVPSSEVLASLEREIELAPIGAEGTARLFAAGGGRIGLVSPQTEPFCGTCGRLRLTTEGRLLACLHEETGVDLRGPLRDGDGGLVEQRIREAIAGKPATRPGSRRDPMHAVGG